MKTLLIILITVIAYKSVYAQQESQYSMYFFNPLLINPAYAGSQDALNATMLIRNQWTGMEGAPKSQCLTLHSPLKSEKIGLGLTVMNDQLGVTKNTGAYADLSYSIRLNQKNDRLAFGLKLGVDYFQKDFSKLRVSETTDNFYTNGYNYSKALFNAGFGMYYYGKRFFLGASSPRLIQNKIAGQTGSSLQNNHYYAFGGLVVKLNPMVNMRPSIMVRYVNNAPLSLEGNVSFLILDQLWIGAMYRHKAFVGGNVSYNITQKFKVGYAYDYALNALQTYSSGSHEFMLSYNLKTKSKSIVSPRFF